MPLGTSRTEQKFGADGPQRTFLSCFWLGYLRGRRSNSAFGEKRSVVIAELRNQQRVRINFVDDTVLLINAS